MGALLQIRTIAGNTLVESIRQPIFTVLLLLGLLLLAVSPAFSAFTLEDDNKLLLDMGLSTIFIGGLFLAAFTATGVVNQEIEQKTVLTVVSKPVSRPVFVLGKFFGVLGALALAHWIWSLGFLLALRHQVLQRANDPLDEPVLIFGFGTLAVVIGIALALNYFKGRVFGSSLAVGLMVGLPVACLLAFSFDKQWNFQSPIGDLDDQVLIALALLLEAEAILCAIAVAASTRFGQTLTLITCCFAFLAGLTSDYLLGRFADANLFARIGYAAVPNLQFHWLADALTQSQPVNFSYVLQVSGYSGFYVVAILALATALFQNREVG